MDGAPWSSRTACTLWPTINMGSTVQLSFPQMCPGAHKCSSASHAGGKKKTQHRKLTLPSWVACMLGESRYLETARRKHAPQRHQILPVDIYPVSKSPFLHRGMVPIFVQTACLTTGRVNLLFIYLFKKCMHSFADQKGMCVGILPGRKQLNGTSYRLLLILNTTDRPCKEGTKISKVMWASVSQK